MGYIARPTQCQRCIRRLRNTMWKRHAANPAQSALRRDHDASAASGRSSRSSTAGCSAASDRPRIVDLLFHLPTGTIDRRARPKLRDVVPDTVVTVAVTVDRHRPPPPHRPRAPYQVYASDETGDLILTFFNARTDYLEKLLPVGERRYVSGTVALYDGMLQMVHPDRVVAEADLAKLPLVEPVYPLTEGLSLNQVRKAADAALDAAAGPAGMAGSELGRARALPAVRGGAAHPAPPGGAGRRRAGGTGLDAARL